MAVDYTDEIRRYNRHEKLTESNGGIETLYTTIDNNRFMCQSYLGEWRWVVYILQLVMGLYHVLGNSIDVTKARTSQLIQRRCDGT